jgi:hypothetical protein
MEILPDAVAAAPADRKPQTFKKEVPMNLNIITNADDATDAREALLNLISGRLETIRATPEDRIEWVKEAADVLAEIEAWTAERHPAGHLTYRDPAASITVESI